MRAYQLPRLEVCLDRGDLAEDAFSYQVADLTDDGVEASPHRLHHEQAAFRCERDDLFCLLGRDGEGFLDQDCPACEKA